MKIRPLSFVAVLVLVVSACSSGSGGGAESTVPPDGGGSAEVAPTTTQQSAPDATQPTNAPAPSGGSSEDSIARVTVLGSTYEFDDTFVGSTCDADFFGGFFAVMRGQDISQTFAVELWNSGSGEGRPSTASMNLTTADGTEYDLNANPEMEWPTVEAGTSRVESFTYEGNRATGTIYFIDSEVAYGNDGPYEPIVADFEIVCADS